MAETTVNLEINEAYTKLKAVLAEKGCRIITEAQSKSLTVQQGSLWGVSPKTAQKTIKYEFLASGTETRITSNSALSACYVKLTVVGCVFAVALALLCMWISFDLAAFAESQIQSFWSWLITAEGYASVRGALLLSDLTLVFAVFLVAVLALEGFIVAFVHFRIGCFAEEVLHKLSAA